MRVWVETTADRIKALRSQSVWEIGCGTGLLLFRVAPGIERYYGTDISQTAIRFLEQQLQRPESQLPHVRLERKAAHEFDSAATRNQFDAVVMNSVVQYFPDLDYFQNVLEGAIESVRPGGAVFIGDVRSLPLLEAFHTSVEVFKADSNMSRQDSSSRVQKGIRQEGELLLDPAFFHAICQSSARVTHVEIQLKRGRAYNELTRFRYDVVLYVGNEPSPRVECPWLDWKKQGLTLSSLENLLQTTQPELLGLTGIRIHACMARRSQLIGLTPKRELAQWPTCGAASRTLRWTESSRKTFGVSKRSFRTRSNCANPSRPELVVTTLC